MMSSPETLFMSDDVPREVKVGLITKPDVFQNVRVLLQMISEFLHRSCLLFSAHSCQRVKDMNLVCFSRITVVRDWKTWILYGWTSRPVGSMGPAVEGDTPFSRANCRTDFRVGDEITLARIFSTFPVLRSRGLLPPLLLAVAAFPLS